MTIFATFYVPDGIAIVSDSRLTLCTKSENGPKEYKILSDSEQKIFLLRNRDVGMVYTAEDMPAGFTMTEFVENMNKFIIKPGDSIVDLTLKINHYINDIENIKISIITAGFDNGEPYVCLIENGKVIILNRDSNNNVSYKATIGGNLKRVNQFFDYKSSFDDCSIEEALEYGYDIVKDSIDYLNNLSEYSNVGGDIQQLEIRRNGGISFVRK
ncbi:hypothetical protein [Sutcliffiella sp. NC1]|uniref:hypothetical protein n=1 Tax=Sutcliffiella sp. NC1 TaxID=3004096 RepID=UPI0022DE0F47|nr:hypothetical protein [Sutcliffiella sp. NC1]WBL16460.1 hypothetical protein O1A01_07460 [Sutcliffiella sp. NC1]